MIVNNLFLLGLNKVWVVGRWEGSFMVDGKKMTSWDLRSIELSEDDAVEKCETEYDFIGEMPIGEVHTGGFNWNVRYPKKG
jgi:hypothetical protein